MIGMINKKLNFFNNQDLKFDLIDSYEVKQTWVTRSGTKYNVISYVDIYQGDGFTYYYIRDPYSVEIKNEALRIINILKKYIDYTDEYVRDPVKCFLQTFQRYLNVSSRVKGLEDAIEYYVILYYAGYGELSTPLSDPDVEDISCVSPSMPIRVWHKRYNKNGWAITNIIYDERALDIVIRKLVYRAGKTVSILKPMVEAILPEGYRLTATWKKEVTPKGSSFTIRKFRSDPYTLTELIALGTLDPLTAAYLWLLVENKGFIIVIGASSTGKTTLINALAYMLPPNSKVISIEDIQELNLNYIDNWKPLVTRPLGTTEDSIDIFDLVKLALRERGDYLILGESRGEEAKLLFQGAATGHGCLTTFHADGINSLIARLKSHPISLDDYMINLIDAVVLMGKVNAGNILQRKVLTVYENSGNSWKSIVKFIGDRWVHAINNTSTLRAESRSVDNFKSELVKRKSFIEYLVKLKVFKAIELVERLRLFYSGGYEYVEGIWKLKAY